MQEVRVSPSPRSADENANQAFWRSSRYFRASSGFQLLGSPPARAIGQATRTTIRTTTFRRRLNFITVRVEAISPQRPCRSFCGCLVKASRKTTTNDCVGLSGLELLFYSLTQGGASLALGYRLPGVQPF